MTDNDIRKSYCVLIKSGYKEFGDNKLAAKLFAQLQYEKTKEPQTIYVRNWRLGIFGSVDNLSFRIYKKVGK